MNELTEQNPIIITKKGHKLEFAIQQDLEAVWIGQDKLSSFFNTSKKDIIKQLVSILKQDHIDKVTHTRRIHYVDYSVKPEQAKNETQYSLTIIIELAFRLESDIALHFQKWAFNILHRHLTWGATFDLNRIKAAEKRIKNVNRNTNKL